MTKEEPERIKQGYQPSPSKNANVIPPNAGSHIRREKHIADLEKENAELKDKLKNLESVAEVRLANWQKYEKGLKEAKELIKQLCLMVRELNNHNVQLTNVDYSLSEAEQFLMEK